MASRRRRESGSESTRTTPPPGTKFFASGGCARLGAVTKKKPVAPTDDAQQARKHALAASGLLGASLAHELRNTLAASESALFLARRDADDAARLAVHLERAEASIRRSQEVVDRVLGLARGEPLRTESASVEPILEAARREIDTPGLSITIALSQPDLEVQCDPILLERLLVNLCVNASEALAGRAARHIALGARRVDNGVVLEVEDNGPGIDPAILPHLFEPLVTDKPSGTGLGLAFCQTIALVHGGTLEALSAPMGGALFRLVLPMG